ncbi:LCP family protein [Caminicella sporogenes]|uniref:LCP family protein n=1 Tax=Caminicella sporogenes TaxID=166485 RepID=UPI002541FD7C|nr:LCP family protein [Caminicella sporogenes]WIF95687.1 LCP family protein [Caminicella sporogenes]
MKTFLKSFIIAFVCFTLLIGSAAFAIMKFADDKQDRLNEYQSSNDEQSSKPDSKPEAEMTELEKLIQKSQRVNILLLGMEGPRTDTIILASFDPKSKNLDLVSIPRDTYFYSAGYDKLDQKKINAVYGRSGIKGIMKVASHVLGGVPIHEYVKVSYDGVEDIVDSLGGVKVNVPFNMDYDDPYAKPPLHIHLKKGVQTLNGKKAIQFLRFRKGNNRRGYPDGDLGRIKAQQQFLMAAMDKALSFRLPLVANTVFKFVKTSMDLSDVIYYAKSAIGIKKENIKTYRLPGRHKNMGLSYFIHDPAETEKLMIEIYKRGLEE